MPPVPLVISTANITISQQLAKEYITFNGTDHPSNYEEFLKFYSNLKVIFLEEISAQIQNVNIAIMTKID
jgi:hypothetical protein